MSCCGPSSSSTDEAIETAVRAAMDAQLVVVDPATDGYRFRHALIGEVVYADLLPSRRYPAPSPGRRSSPAAVRPRSSAGPTGPGSLPSISTTPATTKARSSRLLAAADAAATVAPGAAFAHLERAFELWDVAGDSAAQANRGHRLWQAAELGSATAGNQHAVEVARAAFKVGPPATGRGVRARTAGPLPVGVGPPRGEPGRVREGRCPPGRRHEPRVGSGVRRARAGRAHGRPLRAGRSSGASVSSSSSRTRRTTRCRG